MQDGGGDKDTNRYTRMIAYDISQRSPVLTGEWVVPLPQRKGKTLAASEVRLYISLSPVPNLCHAASFRHG